MNYFWKTLITTFSCVLISTSIWTLSFAQTESMTNEAETQLIVSPKRALPVVSQEIQDRVRNSMDIAMYGQIDESDEDTQQDITTTEEDKTIEYNIANIDSKQVQESRLSWVNHERSTRWIAPLELDNNLVASSTERANYLASKKKFTNMHKRPGQTAYYSTDTIVNRAKSLGIIDDSINVIAESTLWGSANFSSTESFINSTRGKLGWPSGFLGFLIWEKKYNGVHYRMMMSKEFTKVWFWFANAGKHPKYSSRGNQYIGIMHFGL